MSKSVKTDVNVAEVRGEWEAFRPVLPGEAKREGVVGTPLGTPLETPLGTPLEHHWDTIGHHWDTIGTP